LKTQILSESD